MSESKQIPVGRAKDLTNKKFGKLTVLYRVENKVNEKAKWLCQCDCGNKIEVIGTDLTRGHTQSCGCYKPGLQNVKIELNKKYGRLTVIERAGSTKDRHALWKCRCDCGNEIITTGKYLRQGHTQSCGCYQKDLARINITNIASKNFIDETGNRYGKLLVIKKYKHSDASHNVLWECKCDCGNTKIVSGSHLRQGITSSCGCLVTSKGELKIINLLQENNISFQKEYSIKLNNINYRFDFVILKEKEIQYFIEFDGKQHFEKNDYFGGEEQFQKTKQNDEYKNNWCKENNIPLIRIPYYHYNNLCIEDLLLETSIYII